MKQDKRRPSIRLKLLFYFLGFIAVGLALLFCFQTFFLDDLYEMLTIRAVKVAADNVAVSLEAGELEEEVAYWNVKERMSIYVLNRNGRITFKKTLEGEKRELLNADSARQLFDSALENGGEYLMRDDMHFDWRIPKDRPFPPYEEFAGNDRDGLEDKWGDFLEREKGDKAEWLKGIAYAKIVGEPNQNADRMVLISTTIVPVDATLRTLRVQFFVAAFVLALMAALFSAFVSEQIARPILNLNRAAKHLAGDDYQSPPQGGYLEAAELRQTLDETALELKKTQQLQKELIANLSHDLRTPLTMITGYSEAIRDFPEDDVAENIQVVIDEADRLTAMVNDILDLSRLQAGTEHINMYKVDLTQTLQDTVQHFEGMMQREGYRIFLTAEKSVAVNANDIRLSQIVYNLLGNALAHAGEDKTVQVVQTVQGHTVRVSITDHGEGIPREELEHIWERYYRARSYGNRPETGRSGLGLNIVKTLVELHGGECGVESEQGRGSTFWFSLPLYEK